MKLFNTLTRQIEQLQFSKDKPVSIYSCGPTVYDHAHIGNLSSFIYADTLKRVLKHQGLKVRHVMNFTDVDDKTIRRSQELYQNLDPKEALHKLTRHYEDIFKQDMTAISNSVDDIEFIRATDDEVMSKMQEIISTLYETGFAYLADDGVYFSIEAYKNSGKTYGQLTHIDSRSTSKSRIANDEYDKESVHDFALWKLQKDNEPSWDFNLDGKNLRGRPGWHIECSAMSTMKLGQPFDIHTGGIDLIFPHHENEIAQSTAGKDNPAYAKIFFHSEHLLVDGKKMSKSLNNFYTLKDIQDKGYNPLAFRLLVLQSHYKKQSNFTWDNLESAQRRLRSLRNLAVMRFQGIVYTEENHPVKNNEIENHINSALHNIRNNVNTLEFLSEISSISDQLELGHVDARTVPKFENLLQTIDELLGLDLLDEPDITGEQKALLTKREDARMRKDWTRADEVRAELNSQGIEVKDTPSGQIWSRS